MKKIMFFISFFLLVSSLIYSMGFEWRIVVKNSNNVLQERQLELYRYYPATRTLVAWADDNTGWSQPEECMDCNCGCDINDDGNGGLACPDQKLWETMSITSDVVVVLKIDDLGTYYYCKLMIPANLQSGMGYDFELHYNTTTHVFEIVQNQRGTELLAQGLFTNFNITLQNDFDGIDGGGYVKFKYDELDYSQENSPFSITNFASYNWPAVARAEDQTVNNLYRDFQEWQNDQGTRKTIFNNYSLPKESATYNAYFHTMCNITFQNNFISVGNGGIIQINSVQYNSPSSGNMVRGQDITAMALAQTINGIRYRFDEWNDGTATNPKTFYPDSNKTYTASFIGKPDNAYRNLTYSTTVDEPITLDWDEHPNIAVTQYRIWRKIKNGPAGSVIGVVYRGTTTYTDQHYNYVTSGGDVLQYDVQAYYSTEGTYADEDWITIQGEYQQLDPNIVNSGNSEESAVVADELPQNFSLGNYPNPFNPTTNINYSLAADGFVSLKVYNVLGKEVATLVNEVKAAGNYSVSFNASNMPSGVYIYTLQTNGQSNTRKMLLLR